MKKNESSSWINNQGFNIEAESWLELFHSSVKEHPDKIALIFNKESYSYRTLDDMSNKFAQEILNRCSANDQFIGICMDREPSMLAAMIGVHKAGRAYLPLESSFPMFRLNHMITDSKTNIIITNKVETLSASFTCPQKLHYIDSNNITKNSTVISAYNIKKEHPAYIMYTSGSTGLPKGVVISHGSFLNFLLSMKEEPGCTSKDKMLALTTNSFDISGLELFLPLISSASIHLLDKDAIYNPIKLVHTIRESEVTIIQTTPTVWKVLLDSGFTGHRGMKLLCGGEALSKDLANNLFHTGCAVWNMYGPTETTIWSSLYKIDETLHSAPSIGQPIANTGLHIFDEKFNPVGKGEEGQLWISGEGLAQGYWNNEKLTNRVFCDNPNVKGQRIYNTGDIVYENSAGEIIFVGRHDHQVKIRGLRIEIGEIEQTIRDIDGITDVVVLPQTDHNGNSVLVGYYLSENKSHPLTHKEFRSILLKKLPEYMIPSYFQLMNDFPQTLNKKIDRTAFPEISFDNTQHSNLSHGELKDIIFTIWSRFLNRSDFSYEDNFFDIGGHSMLVIQITGELSKALSKDIEPMFFFQFPTINAQYSELLEDKEKINSSTDDMEPEEFDESEDEFSLAIIGISCAVPGADNPEEFWNMLEMGHTGIKDLSDEELILQGLDPKVFNHKNYVKKTGSLPSTKYFDYKFFGYSPKEAMFMDPQHRLMLEHCHKALESGGIIKDRYSGKVGVFASCGQNRYLLQNILFSSQRKEWSDFQTMVGNDNDFLATRVAYKNNLKGPALTVQTGCSSSLVAVQLAYQSLLSYQCDMALCGGISLNLPLNEGYNHEDAAILSPDGLCRAFDADASGTIFGSGVGVVLLKRLSDAKRDHDPIFAVLNSAAINNDGSDKIGFTAPSVQGQSNVIKDAQSLANITPSEVSYIEAHGTGTELGDPIEIKALSDAFGSSSERTIPCYIGSVKTNIGHLDTAAGIIGLIKTALALHHKKIPASLNYNVPNPKMNIEETPFVVNTELRDWEPINSRRVAGVSSFGIGGTNAHVVLESYEKEYSAPESHSNILIYPVSAKSSTVVEQYKNEMEQFVNDSSDIQKINCAYTLLEGRNTFPYRSFFTTPSLDISPQVNLIPTLKDPETVFLFPGQNAQYPGMTKELYRSNVTFKGHLDKCLRVIDKETGWNSLELIFDSKINGTVYTQPILFATEWALGKTLIDYGVPCDMLIGHSLGEYAAACLAGAFQLEDGLKLVINRGRIMAGATEGRMLVAAVSLEDIKTYLPESMDIAAINTNRQMVFAGTEKQISEMEKILSNREIKFKLLDTKSAFHSHLMDPILSDFREVLDTIEFLPLKRPVVSNLTGSILEEDYIYNSDYWIEHLRKTVLFEKGIDTIKHKKDLVYIEVGPGNVLSRFVQSITQNSDKAIIQTLPSISSQEDDHLYFINSLGNIWKAGVDISIEDINKIQGGKRISIPTYPFEKNELWIDPDTTVNSSLDNKSKNRSKNTTTIVDGLSMVIMTLTDIWKRVLGYSDIDRKQNFFNLGGDSLLATELVSQINSSFKVNLQLRDILLFPELEKMAEVIQEKDNSPVKVEDEFPILFPVQTKGSLTPLFLVAGAHENRYYNDETRESSYEEDFLRYFSSLISFLGNNQPIYGFRPKGIFWGEKHHKNVYDMAATYIKELKKVQPVGPYIIGGECVGGSVAIEIAQQLVKSGDVVKHLILMDTPRPSLKTKIVEEYEPIKDRFRTIVKGRDPRPVMKAIRQELHRLIKIYFPMTKNQRAKIHVSESSLFYQRILLGYKVKKYSGDVTLIVNEEWNRLKPNLLWDREIFPNLGVHVVPGNHSTRLSEHGKISGEIINKNINRE